MKKNKASTGYETKVITPRPAGLTRNTVADQKAEEASKVKEPSPVRGTKSESAADSDCGCD